MFGRSTLLSGFLAISLLVCLAGRAMAELMTALFPDSVPGYDADDGIAVDTHLNPEQMPLGVREGAFRFLPSLDESFGYTSNAAARPESARELADRDRTSGGCRIRLVERDAIGAVASAQDTRYVSLPSQDSTDATGVRRRTHRYRR